ncbi:hypothetical protein BJ138DRAFT_1118618 [Hygrophoropsis aurantiaca]|uniref:Uncharacterized protein n=1 Tax=Hygrophoropsis aurantiaca TaxID=72124 RepID=A0ACB7ZX85_9AGAM|nr:hypothetical protein BJ138DRAFT_1118618 [Hygrophoropsis aurantiaca]
MPTPVLAPAPARLNTNGSMNEDSKGDLEGEERKLSDCDRSQWALLPNMLHFVANPVRVGARYKPKANPMNPLWTDCAHALSTGITPAPTPPFVNSPVYLLSLALIISILICLSLSSSVFPSTNLSTAPSTSLYPHKSLTPTPIWSVVALIRRR